MDDPSKPVRSTTNSNDTGLETGAVDSCASDSAISGPTRAPVSAYGIVHVFRCTECGFESLIRHRFASHVPCANKRDSYLIYTCSKCSACSTSQILMQEHGELCHSDQPFNIEKCIEKFIKLTEVNCAISTIINSPGTTRISHSPLNSCYKDVSPSAGGGGGSGGTGTLALAQQSLPIEPPTSHTHCLALATALGAPQTLASAPPPPPPPLPPLSGMQSGPPLDSRLDDWMPNINSMASFFDLMNAFTSNVANHEANDRKVPDTRIGLDLTSSDPNDAVKDTDHLVCPVCHQKWNGSTAGGAGGGSALEELAKHLALVHLFPFPAILNYLSAVAVTANPVGQNLTELTSKLDHVPMAGSLSAAHPFHSASMLSTNPPGDKPCLEGPEWIMRAANANAVEPETSLGNSLRTLKREHPTSETLNERGNWDERNVKQPLNTQTNPHKLLDCPHCGRGCCSVTQLQQHLLQTHSDQLAVVSGLGRWPFPPAIPSILPVMWPGPSRAGNPIRTDPQQSELALVGSESAGTPPVSGSAPVLSHSAIGVNPFDQQSTVTSPSVSASSAPFVNWQLAAAAAAAAATAAAAFGMPFPGANSFGPTPRTTQQQLVGGGGGASASTLYSEPKRPKLQGTETRLVSPATNNGLPAPATDSMSLSFPCFPTGLNPTNTAENNNNSLSMEALKLPNPLWGPQLPPSSNPAKFPDFACPTLFKPDLVPNYPPLVPPFPFCDSLNMLPSLYASVQQQQQRSIASGGLSNLTPESVGTNGSTTLWNEDHSDSMSDRRGVIGAGFTCANMSRRPPRLDPIGSEQLGTNSDSLQASSVSRNRTGHSKSHDLSIKASREAINASTTTAASTTSLINPVNTSTNVATAIAEVASTTVLTTTAEASATPTITSTVPYPENQTSSINGLVHNTLRKTRSDMKVIHRYLVQVKHDTRDIHQIPYYELDQYIQDFVLTAKKKDGHEYEPESLKAFVHSLERHLKHHDYPHSVLKGSAFTGTRTVLNQRLNELRALSRSGGSANMASSYTSAFGAGKRPPDDSSIDVGNTAGHSGISKRAQASKSLTTAALIQAGLLGKDNPQAILNSLWLVNRTQFNIGGTQRHRNLVWGQFQLVTDERGVKAIKFTPLFESAEVRYCRGYGGSKSNATDFNSGGVGGRSPSGVLTNLTGTGLAKRQPLPFNCVELFELYASLRPVEARGVSEPFYLCPESAWEQTGNWFKTSAAGSQLLSRVPRLLGLKPSREPLQMEQTVTDQRDPDLSRESTILTNGDRNYGPFSQSQSAFAKNLLDQQFSASQLGPNPSAAHPSIPPNLFNLFPFVFNCSSESGGPSIPNPYLIPSTAYANLMMNSPTSIYSTRFDQEIDSQSGRKFAESAPVQPRGSSQEADDLSQSSKPESRGAKPSPNQSILRSPVSHTELCSDGTPSPTDAENFSLSDASPRLSCTTAPIEKTTSHAQPAHSPRLAYATPSGMSNSHKDSGSSNPSLKMEEPNAAVSSDASSVDDVERQTESSKQMTEPQFEPSASDCATTWSNEAINLTTDC